VDFVFVTQILGDVKISFQILSFRYQILGQNKLGPPETTDHCTDLVTQIFGDVKARYRKNRNSLSTSFYKHLLSHFGQAFSIRPEISFQILSFRYPKIFIFDFLTYTGSPRYFSLGASLLCSIILFFIPVLRVFTEHQRGLVNVHRLARVVLIQLQNLNQVLGAVLIYFEKN
jgi:hypothetical protein